MSASAISKRYARALMQLGVEQNRVEQFAEELSRVLAVFAAEANLRPVLEGPTYPFEKRAAILSDLADALGLSAGIRNFLGLLLEKNRLGFLAQISQQFRGFADELGGRLRARMVSATALDEQQVAQIRTSLEQQTGMRIVLDTAVEPALIGGLKAEFGGRVFDGSLATQLKRIEDTLTKG